MGRGCCTARICLKSAHTELTAQASPGPSVQQPVQCKYHYTLSHCSCYLEERRKPLPGVHAWQLKPPCHLEGRLP